MATYDELRDAMRHINDLYGDPDAWQHGLSPQDIADINGFLNAQANRQLLAHPPWTPAAYGWADPLSHKLYAFHPTSTGDAPQVPDTLIGSLRNHFPGLFGPDGSLRTPPPGQLPALPGSPTGNAPPGAPTDPAGPGLPTGEQQSGRTADAVHKMQEELKKRYSQINAAEEGLSEALLNAHATTAEGQQKLNDIQTRIIEAVDNPSSALDTPAGETQFVKFLRTQVTAIADVLNSGTLTAADQAKAVKALTDLYAANPGSVVPGAPDPSAAAGATVPESPAPQPDPAADPVDPEESMPDPSLSDLGLGAVGGPLAPMPDPLASLASTLPTALSTVPPPALGGMPLDQLGGLTAPLAGLAAQLGEAARQDDWPDTDAGDAKTSNDGHAGDQGQDKVTPDAGTDEPKPPDQQQPAGPPQPAPVSAVPASGAPTTVQLPDGSSATVATPATAEAVRAYLAGTPLDAAYRQAGVDLPPPGTPVTAPIDPSQLVAGDVGMFKDHYVLALGAAKALKDGQVVPLASVSPSPDFLGWMRPPAPAPQGPPATAPAAVAATTG